MYRKPYAYKPRVRSGNIAKGGVTWLAQVTSKIEGNVRTDTRLEERRLTDGKLVYALMEYTMILNSLNPTEPEGKEIHVWSYEEFAQIIDMCGQVLDLIEAGNRRLLPLNLTIDASKGGQESDYQQ